MSDPLKSRQRSLPDHMSQSGDAVSHQIVINLHASGAMSVTGAIEDQAYALAVLENAADAIRGYHARKTNQLIVPSKDVKVL